MIVIGATISRGGITLKTGAICSSLVVGAVIFKGGIAFQEGDVIRLFTDRAGIRRANAITTPNADAVTMTATFWIETVGHKATDR